MIKKILIYSSIGIGFYIYRVKVKEDIINDIYAKYPNLAPSERLIFRRFKNDKLKSILLNIKNYK
jgi:hypothetical protein